MYANESLANDPVNALNALDMNVLLAFGELLSQDPSTEGEDCTDDDFTASNDVTFYRMREGIERFFISDINNAAASAVAQSELFVMLDGVSDSVSQWCHVPGGGNVLYMDGHVEFLKYPSEGPMTRAIVIAMSAI
jgi:prepilin-type processing-associated H-X9-DG protein